MNPQTSNPPLQQPNPIEQIDHYTTLCKAYNDITAALKVMLVDYPQQFRTYISTDERNEHTLTNDRFYTPLVSVNLVEYYEQHYLYFAVDLSKKGYLSLQQHLDVYRCILKHTDVATTAIDIQEYVSIQEYHWLSYETALLQYRDGNMDFKPNEITSKEA